MPTLPYCHRTFTSWIPRCIGHTLRQNFGLRIAHRSMSAVAQEERVLTSGFLSPNSPCKSFLILLNWTLPASAIKLWSKASFKICADGGSNRLYDSLPAMLGLSEQEALPQRALYLPDRVLGDLDSMRNDVRDFYQGHGVAIQDLSYDQDTTDLMKCLNYLESSVLPKYLLGESSEANTSAPSQLPPHDILVLGALGGRLDHTLSNLNSLYQYPHLNITLWGDGNLVRLLKPGKTVIQPNRKLEGPSCGLVPLGGPALATSSGLRWNLCDTKMEISGLISTCNIIDADEVVVRTDRELLWMTSVEELSR